MATYTFYADASDIAVRNSNANFSTARNAASGTLSGGGASTTYASVGLESGTTYNFYIVFYPFDTSSIPASEPISDAVFSFSLVGDNAGTAANQWAVTQSTQATWNSIIGGDFDQRGATDGATRVNRKVSTETGYQDMTLTATGRGWIAKSGITNPSSASASGKTQLVMAWAKDIDNSAPATNDYNQVYLSEQTGTTNDPKLVVTTVVPYSMAASAGSFTLTGVAANLARTAYQIAAAVGSFVLTGVAARLRVYGWVNNSRPTSTWTDVTRSDQ